MDEAPFILNNAKRKLRLVLSTTDLHTADFRHTSVRYSLSPPRRRRPEHTHHLFLPHPLTVQQNTTTSYLLTNTIGPSAESTESTTNLIHFRGNSVRAATRCRPAVPTNTRCSAGSDQAANVSAVLDAVSTASAVGPGKYRSLQGSVA